MTTLGLSFWVTIRELSAPAIPLTGISFSFCPPSPPITITGSYQPAERPTSHLLSNPNARFANGMQTPLSGSLLLRLYREEQPRAVLVGWDTLEVATYRHAEF